MIDLLTFAVLGVRGWYGWKRGTLLMLISLVTLFAGYVGAFFLFRPVGNSLASMFHLSPLVAYPVAGILVMGTISVSLRLARASIERRRGMKQQEGLEHSRFDSTGGALISMTWAMGLIFLAAWAMMGIHGAFKVGPDISTSITGRATSAVMAKVTYSITRKRTGNQLVATAVALIAGQPRTGVETVNALLNNQNVRGLWTNEGVRAALVRGDVNALAANPTVRALARDTGFVHAAALLGLGSTGVGQAPGAEQLAVNLVSQAGPLMRSLQSFTTDPEVKRMLSSPQIAGALERGNIAALINDPQFRGLLSRFGEMLRTTR